MVTPAQEELALAAEQWLKAYASPYFDATGVHRYVGTGEVWVRMTQDDGTLVRVVIGMELLNMRRKILSGAGALEPAFEAAIVALQTQLSEAYVSATIPEIALEPRGPA